MYERWQLFLIYVEYWVHNGSGCEFYFSVGFAVDGKIMAFVSVVEMR